MDRTDDFTIPGKKPEVYKSKRKFRYKSPCYPVATHSSTLASKIPWTEKPGRLQFKELQRIRHNSETKHTHTHKWSITFKNCKSMNCSNTTVRKKEISLNFKSHRQDLRFKLHDFWLYMFLNFFRRRILLF